MYSIIDKKDGRIQFLAESDDDLTTVIDSCEPGSTIEVLGKTAAEVHTFIKSPSNKWVIYKGESEFVMPKNDAKVYAFKPGREAPCSLDGTDVGAYQSNLTIYPTGYVTGTSYYAKMISSTTKDHPEKQMGHWVILGLDTPEGATKYDVYDGEEKKLENLTPLPKDDYLLINIHKLTHPEKVKVVYDTEQEFTFNLTGIKLA